MSEESGQYFMAAVALGLACHAERGLDLHLWVDNTCGEARGGAIQNRPDFVIHCRI